MRKYILITLVVLGGLFLVPHISFAMNFVEISNGTIEHLHYLENASSGYIADDIPTSSEALDPWSINGSAAQTAGILSGSDGFNVLNTGDYLAGTTNHTIWDTDIWFKTTRTSGVVIMNSGNQCAIGLNVGSGSGELALHNNGNWNATGYILDDGNWHNVDVDWYSDGKLYVDGVYTGQNYGTCTESQPAAWSEIGNWSSHDLSLGGVISEEAESSAFTSAEISAIWNAGAGARVCDQVGCGGPVPPAFNPSGSIVFPGSTYFGPDFSNWALSYSPGSNAPTSSQNTGYVKVEYEFGSSIATSGIIYSDVLSVATLGTSTINITIPKSQSLFNYVNNSSVSSSWTAALFISSSSVFSASSGQVTFQITPFASTTPNAPGANLGGPFFYNPVQKTPTFVPQTIASSSVALAGSCPAPSNSIFGFFTGSDEYYALCSTINYLLIDTTGGSQAVLSNAFNNLEQSAVFSPFFNVKNQITSAASSMNTSTATGISLPLPTGVGNAWTSTMVMSPDVESNSMIGGRGGYANILFNDMLDFVVLVFIAIIFAIAHYVLNIF